MSRRVATIVTDSGVVSVAGPSATEGRAGLDDTRSPGKRCVFTMCCARVGHSQVALDGSLHVDDLIARYEAVLPVRTKPPPGVVADRVEGLYTLDGQPIDRSAVLADVHASSPLLVVVLEHATDVDQTSQSLFARSEAARRDVVTGMFLAECAVGSGVQRVPAFGTLDAAALLAFRSADRRASSIITSASTVVAGSDVCSVTSDSAAIMTESTTPESSRSSVSARTDATASRTADQMRFLSKHSESRELLSFSPSRPKPQRFSRTSRGSGATTSSSSLPMHTASASTASIDGLACEDSSTLPATDATAQLPPRAPAPPPPPPPPPPPANILGALNNGSDGTKKPMDFRTQLMTTLRDPKLRNRLRKVIPKKGDDEGETPIPTERKQKFTLSSADKRAEALLTLLGYVELAGGNPDELAEKCQHLSTTVRDLLYVMVRKNWLLPVTTGSRSIKIWQGREVTRTEKIHTTSTAPETYVEKSALFRISKSKGYSLDDIYLLEGKKYPGKPKTFDVPEPSVPQDGGLDSRKQWDEYERLKTEFEQSDSFQFGLLREKLAAASKNLRSTANSLLRSSTDMKDSSQRLMSCFDGMENDEILRIVKNIPERINEVRRQVERDTGVIIKDGQVKLTPDFLALQIKAAAASERVKSAAEATAKLIEKDSNDQEIITPVSNSTEDLGDDFPQVKSLDENIHTAEGSPIASF